MFIKLIRASDHLIEAAVMKDVSAEHLPAFKEELYDLTIRVDARVVLNFSVVESICSRALGVLAVASWRLQRGNGMLAVTELNDNLLRLFRIAKLDRSMSVSGRTIETAEISAAA